MARDDRFINLACHIASLSEHPRFRLGAVITKSACILSVGVNKLKSHPRQYNAYTHQKSISIHAELAAILVLSKSQLDYSTMYIARLLANEKSAMAKPCPACMEIILEVGIKRIVWTDGIAFQSQKL
jgi:deoxycytidylate deaminase